MQTKLSVICDRLIEAGWLAAAAVIPFFFNVYSSRVFEPDKLTLLRAIAVIMATAFIIKTVDSLPRDFSVPAWLRRFATATPLVIPVLIFVALYVFTTVTSVAPAISFWGSYQRLQGTLVNLSYITVFFLTAHHLRTRIQLQRLLWVVILASFAISLYGLIQHFRLDPLPWGGDVIMRVTASMGNAIFLAAYLIMAVPITLALLIENLAAVRTRLESPTGTTVGRTPGLGTLLLCWLIPAVIGTLVFGLFLGILQYISVNHSQFQSVSIDWLIPILLVFLIIFETVSLILKLTNPVTIRQLHRTLLLIGALTLILETQLLTILFTQSRGPWIGICAGLIVFAFLTFFRNRLYKIAAVGVIALAILAVFVVMLNQKDSPIASLKLRSPYLERLGTISDMDAGTAKVRRLIWLGDDVAKGAVGLILSDPVRTVIGYGPESMYVAYNRFYPPALANIEARNASPDRSHNDLLDFLVTMGVAGLLSYLAVVAAFLYLTIKLLWRSHDRYVQLVLIAFVAAILGHIFEALFGIAIAATRVHFWLFLAAASAVFLTSKPLQVASDGAVDTVERPNPARSRGSNRAQVASTVRSSRARNQRSSTSRTQPASTAAWTTMRWVWALPLRYYLEITFLAIPWLLLGNRIQQAEPPAIVVTGFLWLALGMALTALWVQREERPAIQWQSSRWWLYAVLVILAGYVILKLLLNSIIADIYFKKAQAYDGVQRFETSSQQYLEALKEAPSQDFYYLFLGRAYLELARKAPNQKSSLSITSVDDLFRLDERRLATLSRDDLFNTSLTALKKAKELNPLNTDNSANLGRLYRFWGEQTTDANQRQEKLAIASQYYADALALSPNAAHLYDEWGLVYIVQGQQDRAIEKFEKALALDKKYVTTYVYFGEAYMSMNQLDKAADMYRKALEIDGSLINVHSSLGYIYYQQGRIQDALQENLAAAQLAPNDLGTHRNLAVIYQEMGNYDKAIAEAQIALSLAPADQKANFQNLILELQKRKSGG